MLLRHLPKGPVSAIQRSSAPLTDLNNIVVNIEGLGRLTESGEWALAILARDALRFASGTDLARQLDQLAEAKRAELEEKAAQMNDEATLNWMRTQRDQLLRSVRLPVCQPRQGLPRLRGLLLRISCCACWEAIVTIFALFTLLITLRFTQIFFWGFPGFGMTWGERIQSVVVTGRWKRHGFHI